MNINFTELDERKYNLCDFPMCASQNCTVTAYDELPETERLIILLVQFLVAIFCIGATYVCGQRIMLLYKLNSELYHLSLKRNHRKLNTFSNKKQKQNGFLVIVSKLQQDVHFNVAMMVQLFTVMWMISTIDVNGLQGRMNLILLRLVEAFGKREASSKKKVLV